MKTGRYRRAARALGLVVVLGLCSYFIRVVTIKPVPRHPITSQQGVLVMAHRGGSGLWPENTLYAFRHAVDLGVDVLDFDIRYLPDGKFAVIHDEMVSRTTNGSGAVADYTLPELQRLDAGYNWTRDNGVSYPYRGQGIRIPSLEEVFVQFPNTRMNIELKQSPPGTEAELCAVIEEFGMQDRIIIASFSAAVIREFRRICPGVATAAGTGEALPFYILNMLYLGRIYHPQTETLQMPGYRRGSQVLTRRFITAAHAHNISVYAWTINDTAQMEALLQAGVDGIITDYPDRLLELLGREVRVKSDE